MKRKYVFKAKLRCKNCGYEWFEFFEKGETLIINGFGDVRRNSFIFFTCRNCAVEGEIEILKRIPTKFTKVKESESNG